MKYILMITVLLAGCGVRPPAIEMAQKVCKDNGGIRIIWGSIFRDDLEVWCENGIYVEMDLPE